MREAKPWPASTGWLVVSILFANKLWIMDVTSMSLYWVARLPIERPKGQTSSRGSVRKSPSSIAGGRLRQWKIALSLAVVGALAAPFAFCTYKVHPTYSVWVPLSAQEKVDLAISLKNSNNCQRQTHNVTLDFECYQEKRKLGLGGDYEYYPDELKYLAINLGAAALAFASIFGLTFLVPMLIRGVALMAQRYWKWLNA
jgi:hypothetical protein